MAKRGKGNEKSSASEDETEARTPVPIPDITRTSPTEAATPQTSAGKSPGTLTVPGKRSRGLSSGRWEPPSDEELTPKPLSFGGPKTPPPTPSTENLTPKPLNFGPKTPSPIKQSEATILAAARLRGGMEPKDGSQGPPPFEDLTPGYKAPPGVTPGNQGGDPDDDDGEWIYETDSDYEVENVPGSKSGWEKPQKPIDYKVRGDVMGMIGDKEAPIPPHLMGKSPPKVPPPGGPPGHEGGSSGSDSESENGLGGSSGSKFEKGGVPVVEPIGIPLTMGAEGQPEFLIPPRTPPNERFQGSPPKSPPPKEPLADDEPPPFEDKTPGYKPPPGSPPHSPPGSPGGGGGDGLPPNYSKLFVPPPSDEEWKQFEVLEKGRILGKDVDKPRTPINQMAAKQTLLAKLAAAAAANGGKADSKVLVEKMKQLPQSILDFRDTARGKTAPPYPEALTALEDALEVGTDAAGQTLQTKIELQQARKDLAAALAQIASFDHDGVIARLTKELDDLKKSTKDKTMTNKECDAHLAKHTKTLPDQLDAAERGAEHMRATANEKIDELTAERDQLKSDNQRLKKDLDDLRKLTTSKTLTQAECDAQHEKETSLLRLQIHASGEDAKWDLEKYQDAIEALRFLTGEKAAIVKSWMALVQKNVDFNKKNQESVGGIEPGVKSPQQIHDTLKNKYVELKKENETLKKGNDDLIVLNRRISELEKELDDVKSVKSTNSEDQTTRAECDERIKKETKHLQDEIKRLQKQLADVKASLTLFHTMLNWDITKIGLTETEAKVFDDSLNDNSWTQDNIDTWLRVVADETDRLRTLISSHEVKIHGLEEDMHGMITQDNCDIQNQPLKENLAEVQAALTSFHGLLNWQDSDLDSDGEDATDFENRLNAEGWTQDNIEQLLHLVTQHIRRLQDESLQQDAKIHGLEEEVDGRLTQELFDARNELAITQKEAKIANLQAAEAAQDAEISKHKTEISEKMRQIQDLDQHIEDMLTEEDCATKNAAAIAQKNQQIKDLEGDTSKLEQKLADLQKQINDKDKEISDFNESKKGLTTEDDCAARNTQALADKDKRIEQLEADKAKLEKQIKRLKDAAKDLMSREDCAAQNKKALTHKEKKITELEAAKAKLEKQINALNDAATDLITEGDCAARNVKTLSDKDQTIADLQAANQKLKSEAPPGGWVTQETHTEHINALNVGIADLEQKLTASEAEVGRLGDVLAAHNIQTTYVSTQAQTDQKDAEIKRLDAVIANNEAACDAEKQKLKDKIEDLEKNLEDAEEEIRLLTAKTANGFLLKDDPQEAQTQLTQYLKNQVNAEIARLNAKIVKREKECADEKKALIDEIQRLNDQIAAHQCQNDDQLRAEITCLNAEITANQATCDAEKKALQYQIAAFARNIAALRDRVNNLQGQVDGTTDAVIKGKDDEIKRLKDEIAAHKSTIAGLETVRDELNATADAQRLNLVANHQASGLRARITALENQIRNLTGQDPPPPPPSPSGSDDSSSSGPPDEKYTPTADSNDLQILRIDMALLCMVHQRAFNGFVQGDTNIALNAANDAVRDAQTFRDSLPQNTPGREEAFGRALYWQGLVAYYGDNLGDATTFFVQSDSIAWTHADRSNLQGWIERCENGISVDKRKEAYTPKPAK